MRIMKLLKSIYLILYLSFPINVAVYAYSNQWHHQGQNYQQNNMRPEPNYYQTHHINNPPNTINLNQPGPNTINLNRPSPNTVNVNPHPNYNGYYGNQNYHQNHGNHNHYHNYNVPYVIYYGTSYYPYYPTYSGYVSYDNSEYTSYDDTPSMSITDINNSVNNINQSIPDGYWIQASQGQVPANAIVYQSDSNGNNTYYCRANYNSILYYGVLVAGDGCYSQDGSTTVRFTDYEVLITY